jgi:FkbM family methyltransferase
MDLKSTARRAFNLIGYDVYKISGGLGRNPFRDMRALMGGGRGLVAVDVGANIGQTVHRLRAALNAPVIHAFEPSPSTFAELRRRTEGVPDLYLANRALGARPGTMELIENIHSDMSSFLEIGAYGWGEVRSRTPVKVGTLDEHCEDFSIDRLDLVKSDTQGYDLEVLRGAQGLLGDRRIHLVFIEINFIEVYDGLPRVDAILGFMQDHGFRLVSFYNFRYRGDQAGWADALFICPDFAART